MKSGNSDVDHDNQKLAVYALVLGALAGFFFIALGYQDSIVRRIGWLIVFPALGLGGLYINQRSILSRADQRTQLNMFQKAVTGKFALVATPGLLMFMMGLWFVMIIYN